MTRLHVGDVVNACGFIVEIIERITDTRRWRCREISTGRRLICVAEDCTLILTPRQRDADLDRQRAVFTQRASELAALAIIECAEIRARRCAKIAATRASKQAALLEAFIDIVNDGASDTNGKSVN